MTRKTGFTLIELLVVIAIIALLAAILFPVFAKAKFAAKRTVDISNLKQVGIAIDLYMGDNDDLFPWAVDTSDKYHPEIWASNPAFQAQIPSMPQMNVALDPYAKSAKIFECPLDTGLKVLDTHPDIGFDIHPSLFKVYGLSYLWRTEFAVKGMSQSSLQNPSSVNLMFTAAGHWLGTGRALELNESLPTAAFLLQGYRYDVLFGDFHAKNLSYADYQNTWNTSL